jgi:hypothetical protein
MEHWKTHSAIGTKASALSLTKPSWPSQHDQPTTLHTLAESAPTLTVAGRLPNITSEIKASIASVSSDFFRIGAPHFWQM